MTPKNLPHQSHLRKGRFSEEGRAYALTKCAFHGISLIEDPSDTMSLIEALFWMESQNVYSLGAFVVLPDHYHAVIVLTETKSLSHQADIRPDSDRYRRPRQFQSPFL